MVGSQYFPLYLYEKNEEQEADAEEFFTDAKPDEAEYVVNGKPALEWVMERQAVMEDKESGIVNDANLWGIETMENPRYPLELFQRVITVSLETLKTIEKLPALDI
jgi:predicted helicase